MIKLLVPFNFGGTVIEAGIKQSFPPDVEKALVDAGNAEPVSNSIEETTNSINPDSDKKPGTKPGQKGRGNR